MARCYPTCKAGKDFGRYKKCFATVFCGYCCTVYRVVRRGLQAVACFCVLLMECFFSSLRAGCNPSTSTGSNHCREADKKCELALCVRLACKILYFFE